MSMYRHQDKNTVNSRSATIPTVVVPTLGTFRVTDKGVFFAPPGGKTMLVCSRIEVVARAVDEQGRDIGKLLRWKDSKGHEREWVLSNEALNSGSQQYRCALEGLQIVPWGTIAKVKDLLGCYFAFAQPTQAVRCVSRTGWQGSSYVLPGGQVIGPQVAGPRLVLQTSEASSTLPQASGTLEDWQKYVGAPCRGNTRLVHAVSAAFAAPLVRLIGGEGFGFHLRGHSSSGKTTALQAAASVWGSGGDGGYVRPWRATVNGLESIATSRCDALLPLDEIGEIDPREVGKAAYMLANGCGKIRANSQGGAREAARWRLIFLSSGEVSLEDHMNEGGKKAKAGQSVRMIHLPADAGRGQGLFENLHGRSAKELAEQIKGASQKYYGTPIVTFLEKLIENQDDVPRWVAEKKKEFLAKVQFPANASGQAHRVADHFALVAAGGELAIHFGIAPWGPGEAIQAGLTCFHAWLESCEGAGGNQDIEKALEQLKAQLQRNYADLPAITDHGQRDLVGENVREFIRSGTKGFKRMSGVRVKEYLIYPWAFREFCSGYHPHDVAQILLERGFLKSDKGKAVARPERIPSGPARMYVISGSFTEDDAEEETAPTPGLRVNPPQSEGPSAQEVSENVPF